MKKSLSFGSIGIKEIIEQFKFLWLLLIFYNFIFSESGNLLAFGYRLPEKSYAIFRLPPPALSAKTPQHRRQDPYTKVFKSNNLNRARKVVSSSSQNTKSRRVPENFRRDKKEIGN